MIGVAHYKSFVEWSLQPSTKLFSYYLDGFKCCLWNYDKE